MAKSKDTVTLDFQPPPSVQITSAEDPINLSHLEEPPPSVIMLNESNKRDNYLDVMPPTPAVSPPRQDLHTTIIQSPVIASATSAPSNPPTRLRVRNDISAIFSSVFKKQKDTVQQSPNIMSAPDIQTDVPSGTPQSIPVQPTILLEESVTNPRNVAVIETHSRLTFITEPIQELLNLLN